MQKSLRSADYARLIEILVAARHRAGMRHQGLAKKLDGRNRSLPNTRTASGALTGRICRHRPRTGCRSVKLLREFLSKAARKRTIIG
jgi:hypothetical protein